MKAVLCKAWGPPDSLTLETLPDLVPGDGEVVIDVKAAGVNFPDVLIIQNKYQAKPELPFSPGSELAGVVNAVGAGSRTSSPATRSSPTSATARSPARPRRPPRPWCRCLRASTSTWRRRSR
jgi:NADPH2:quinone reductase